MPLQAAGLHDEAPQLALQPLSHGTISRPVDDVAHLDRDPFEISNVINRPAYRAVRERFRRELRRRVVEGGGRWRQVRV